MATIACAKGGLVFLFTISLFYGVVQGDDRPVWYNSLIDHVGTVTNFNSLSVSIRNIVNNTDASQFKTINGTALVSEMAENVKKMLHSKMEALNRSVVVAEAAAANHTWVDDLDPTAMTIVNAKDKGQLASILSYDPRFRQKINNTVSSVHIPVEIYEKDPHILNGLKWSRDLDSVFQENYKDDDQILWQYFGSQTGFMRTFPASEWQMPPNGVDLYDVRRRPWYTQGSSSPKDMLILLDTSGSVHGQSLQLIRVAVKSILDTLGENDFVYIARFSETASNVSCFTTFVQANYRNKQILSDAVSTLQAGGMANFEAGFNFAFERFEQFENSSGSGVGANCNRMIMLLTDGGTDTAESVFKTRNWNRPVEKQIRVFTYAVGQNPNPTKDVRWMACANRGRFSEIRAMGAIRARVQEYNEVVVRPLALDRARLAKWTCSYAGQYAGSVEYTVVLSQTFHPDKPLWSSIYEDQMGLGMMTTVTLPVYNKSIGASNQTILGVMGIDVTTDQMKEFSPVWQLGPNGYTFAINTNGYVIFHPNLKIHTLPKTEEEYDALNETYLKDPPNMDLLDIEIDIPEKEQVRKEMIDNKSASKVIKTNVVAPEKRHVDMETREYFYTGIPGTSFSLGLTLPDYQKKHLVIPGSLDAALAQDMIAHIKDGKTVKLIAPWDYYKDMKNAENLTGTAEDLLEPLQNRENYEWDQDKILRLAWDLNITKIMSVFWQDMQNNVFIFHGDDNTTAEEDTDTTTIASFVGTYGGLTQVYPASAANLMMEYRDTWNASYFRRALDSENYIFSAPYTLEKRKDNTTIPPIMVAKSVTLKVDNMNFKPAVAGALMINSYFVSLMENASSSCKNSADAHCYLLDDGAFVIATNLEREQNQIGRFFGYVDPGIMSMLRNTSYKILEEYDYQATCTVDNDGSASAAPLAFRIPSINLLYEFLSVSWWTSFWSWSVLNMNLYGWLYPVQAESPFDEEVEVDRNCIKKLAQYYYAENVYSSRETIHPCDSNCTRDYTAERINKTNLLLVVVSPFCPNCNQTAQEFKLIQEPKEALGDDAPDFCNQQPRYRRNPEECYDYDPDEDTTQCAGPISRPVSLLLICLATILSIFITTIR